VQHVPLLTLVHAAFYLFKRYILIALTFFVISSLFYVVFLRKYVATSLFIELLLAALLFGAWYYIDEKRRGKKSQKP
jgi:Na+-translocating ferredoxin:NAD+ oxidoreductase RnfD subunit